LSYIGLVFDSGGDEPAWYMAGWFRDYNSHVAGYLIDFVNREIADRFVGKVSKYNGRIGRGQDRIDEIHAYEDVVERKKMDYWSHISPYDPSKLNRENAAKAELLARTAGPLSVGSYRMVVIKKGEQPTSDFSSLSDAARRSDDIAFAPGNVAGAFVFNSEFRLVHVAIHPYVLGPKEKPVRATPYPDNIGKLMLERK
jgi:hypothetical protein